MSTSSHMDISFFNFVEGDVEADEQVGFSITVSQAKSLEAKNKHRLKNVGTNKLRWNIGRTLSQIYKNVVGY